MKILENNAISAFSSSIRIEIKYNGYAFCDKNWHENEVHSPYSRLYYIKSGEGIVEHNRKTIRLLPGKLYFIPLGITFSYRCDDYMEKLFFHINVPLAQKYDLFADCKEIICLDAPDIDLMQEKHNNIKVFELASLHHMIYGDVLRILKESGMTDFDATACSKTVHRALDYINSNLSIKLNIRDISENVYVSESTLSKAFLSEIGVNIGKYIDDKVIFEIEKLLTETNMSVNEISEKFSFCDRAYLCRKFKSKTGCTPSQYRRKMKDIYKTYK